MTKLLGLMNRAALSAAACAAVSAAHADFSISNANIAIGIDDSVSFGNMLSVFDGVGGRLDTGGPHDFWYDGFGGFAETSVAVRDGGGFLLSINSNGQGWAVGPTVTHQTDPGTDFAIIEGEPMAGVFHRRVIRIDAGTKYARVTDTFRNDTGMIINPGVLDNVDTVSPFTADTFNDLASVLGVNDFVTATIAPSNTLTVGFGSNNAVFRFNGLGSTFLTNPFGMAVIDPNGALVDNCIQAASNFGVLLPGQEVSNTWFISFGSTKAEATSVYVAANGAGVFEIGPVGNQFVDEHDLLTVSVPVNNPGGGTITWSVDGPAGMVIDANGVITWTPGELDGGNVYPVEVEASNGSTTATTSFNVTVVETNTAPEIAAIGDVTVDEGTTANADADATDSDVPVQGLTFSMVSGPAGATIHSGTGAFSWTPGEAAGPGSFPVTVRVRDDGPGLLTDETTFSVHVEEVNQAPTITPIADQNTSVGSTVSLTASASDPDLPANDFTWSLDPGAPAGASIDANSGAFSWTPGNGTAGDHTIVVRVADDGAPSMSDTEEFVVHVDPPSLVFAYTGDHSAEYSDPTVLSARVTDDSDNPIQGLELTFTLGTFSASDTTDANGEATVATILNQPAGTPDVVISFAGNGTFDPFSHTEAYEILREKVQVTYMGDASVATGTNKTVKAAIRFYAIAQQEIDGFPGDMTGAALEYTGFVSGNPVFGSGSAPIDSIGRSVIFKSVTAGQYAVDIDMAANDYWRVSPPVTFNLSIVIGQLRESSGAGWIPFGAGNGHGSFNFKSSFNNAQETGKSSFDFVSSDGHKYLIVMDKWLPGALILGTGSDAWKSAFTGYADVTKTHLMTGQVTTFMDVPLTVDAWDGNRAMPVRPDAYGFVLLDENGFAWFEADLLNAGGGTIKIN